MSGPAGPFPLGAGARRRARPSTSNLEQLPNGVPDLGLGEDEEEEDSMQKLREKARLAPQLADARPRVLETCSSATFTWSGRSISWSSNFC